MVANCICVDDYGNPVDLSDTKVDELLENLPNKIRNKLNINCMVQDTVFKGKKILKVIVFPAPYPVSFECRFYNVGFI